jgi:hypothetical protein
MSFKGDYRNFKFGDPVVKKLSEPPRNPEAVLEEISAKYRFGTFSDFWANYLSPWPVDRKFKKWMGISLLSCIMGPRFWMWMDGVSYTPNFYGIFLNKWAETSALTEIRTILGTVSKVGTVDCGRFGTRTILRLLTKSPRKLTSKDWQRIYNHGAAVVQEDGDNPYFLTGGQASLQSYLYHSENYQKLNQLDFQFAGENYRMFSPNFSLFALSNKSIIQEKFSRAQSFQDIRHLSSLAIFEAKHEPATISLGHGLMRLGYLKGPIYRLLTALNKKAGPMIISDKAQDYYESCLAALNSYLQKDDWTMACFSHSAGQMLAKLMMIHALDRFRFDSVGLADAKMAWESFLDIFEGWKEFAQLANFRPVDSFDVLKFIRSRGQVTSGTIYKHFALERKMLPKILIQLMQMREIKLNGDIYFASFPEKFNPQKDPLI